MQIIIFLIEVSLIFLLVEMDDLSSKNVKVESTQYSSYYSLNEIGDSVLRLKGISSLEKKIDIWKNSSLKDEMILDFPDIDIMSEFIRNRIIDDDKFKKAFIEYMEYTQGRYLSGEITQDEFKNALLNPNPKLPTF